MAYNSGSFPGFHTLDHMAGALGKRDVIIIVPPFAGASAPVLGPSVLLDDSFRKRFNCRVYYSNLVLASMIGPNLYERIAGPIRIGVFDSDGIFAPYAFDMQKGDLASAMGDGEWGIRPEELSAIDGLIPHFLDYVIERILLAEPSIVGFSAFSREITSSLAMAKRIKESNEGIITVIGGNCVTRPLGDALIDIAPMIDYVFSGEADSEFPHFCNSYFSGGTLPASKIIDCKPVDEMDSVKTPNFDDYFQQLGAMREAKLVPEDWPVHTPFESSRGCWWGEKHACSFCGFDGAKIRYRQKSRKRIVDEIAGLSRKHGPGLLAACDSVIPVDFKEVADDLIDLDLGLRIWYQIRSTVTPSFLDMLVKAGITSVQPGIESLSTNILKRMRKGVTALQNLRLLREAASRRISVWWNFIMGVPGESDQDYEAVLAILPFIEHLQPPTCVGRIHIDRYSRYFSDSERFGIRNIRPCATYKFVYPAYANLEQLAYYFEADFDSICSRHPDLYKQIRTQCDDWLQSWVCAQNPPSLHQAQTAEDWPIIKDTRKIAGQTFTVLDKEAGVLLDLLSEPARAESIPEGYRPYLPELLERKFVMEYEQHFISLVTDPNIGLRLRTRGIT